jgi:hypothetical protein
MQDHDCIVQSRFGVFRCIQCGKEFTEVVRTKVPLIYPNIFIDEMLGRNVTASNSTDTFTLTINSDDDWFIRHMEVPVSTEKKDVNKAKLKNIMSLNSRTRKNNRWC